MYGAVETKYPATKIRRFHKRSPEKAKRFIPSDIINNELRTNEPKPTTEVRQSKINL